MSKQIRTAVAELRSQGFTVLTPSAATKLNKTINDVRSSSSAIAAELGNHDPRATKTLRSTATRLQKQAARLTV